MNAQIKPSHQHSSLIITFLIILSVLLSAACTPQSGGQASPTAAATGGEKAADSPVPPTDTLQVNTPTLGATNAPLPTLTPTPGPYAVISGNTNCRTGPGSVYDLLHTYLAGDQAQLLGKSPDGFFWYTSDQGGFAPDCWLWGEYATPVGDTAPLPIFTPPPTPTPSPDFEIRYVNADIAMGSWYLFFEIENTGNETWESALLFVHEPTVRQDAGRFSNRFQVNDHSPDPTQDNIPPGSTAYFHAARIGHPGNYGETPDVVDIYFVACTEEYMGGYCVTKMWSENVW